MRGTWRQMGQLLTFLLATLALGFADAPNTPPPGTLNYVEGQVLVQGQVETPKSVGSAYVESGQTLETQNGNAEMLLTPGVYVRLGHDSAVTMLSPGLADTQVELTKGSALLEVDELFKQNNISVVLDRTTTQIEKQGLYDFNAQPASVKVVDGKATISEDDRHISLKKGHEALLAEGQAPVVRKFDQEQFKSDSLYRWSMLRSEYATESNVNEGYALMAGGGWWGPGWYWNPYWMDFAFMPGFGMMWGPFGYPFFAPWNVGYAPYYGFYGHGAYPGHYPYLTGRGPTRALPSLGRKPAPGSAGFRALPRTMSSGHMRASMGGFHGGSMGGGVHGSFGGGFHGGFGGRR